MIRVRTLVAVSWNCPDMKRLGHPGKAALEVGQVLAGRRHGELHPHEEMPVRCAPRTAGWARMFAECWTRKLDTAYTMPGRSGQSVSANSPSRSHVVH